MNDRDLHLHDHVLSIVYRRCPDPGFGVEQLAAALGMSRSTLHRRLIRAAGQSPGRLIRDCRLERAAEMLECPSPPITEIAAEVGYSDPAHFTRSFKRRFGRTPTAHRRAAAADGRLRDA